jgi:hypothetical protein
MVLIDPDPQRPSNSRFETATDLPFSTVSVSKNAASQQSKDLASCYDRVVIDTPSVHLGFISALCG